MIRLAAALAVVLAAALLVFQPKPARRVVQLPAGVVEVHREISVDGGTDLRGAPSGTVLHAAPDFAGRAILVIHGAGALVHDLTVDGNRDALEVRSGLPPSNAPFARFTRNNGILAEDTDAVTLERVRFHSIAGFAVLVNRSRHVTLDRLDISDSGSRNPAGRNNTTGGILLEEGTSDFRVTNCRLRRVRGNGVWTHSLYTSPRNARGRIADNRFEDLARDAIQVGHATQVTVEENSGARIGFPVEEVDTESQAIPVGIDTAGNVDRSSYARNRFEEINGKCIDLDGFHDGDVTGNICVNRGGAAAYPCGSVGILFNDSNPHTRSNHIRVTENVLDGVKFSGIFAFGTGNVISNNRLLRLNLAHCNEDAARFGCYYPAGEPDALQAGIYLGRGVLWPEPARGNTVENNDITGYQMKARCIEFAPGVKAEWNRIRGNKCRDE